MSDTLTAPTSEAAFRDEARAWLAANAEPFRMNPEWSEQELVDKSLAWMAKKYEAGYALITNPPELGGRNGTPALQRIFQSEEARYRPANFTGLGIAFGMALPTIKKHGTAEQYARFAGPTVKGQAGWCQLFSEPAAGSDLAGVRAKAVKDGDNWIVNGQKVWSSWAHHARYGILLARTDPTVVKHQGLTFFVVDMQSPGVEVRPIKQISGKSDFNETFLTDVVIPDSNPIGAEGEGWACAMTVLMNERNGSGGSEGGGSETEQGVKKFLAAARNAKRGSGTAADSASVRAKLAQWWVEEQGLKNYALRIQAATAKGETPPPAVAMMKLISATKLQQTNAFMMDVNEYGGLFATPDQPGQDEIHYNYIWASAMRIAGGADEILRNQLAERVLGLPGEIRVDKVPFNQLPG